MLERELLLELEEYIERHLVRLSFAISAPLERTVREEYLSESIEPDESEAFGKLEDFDELQGFDKLEIFDNLEDFVNATRQPAFRKVLFGLIDDQGTTDADVYKRAGMDRRHFSKIRSSDDYRPSKHTVIALALALQLNKNEANRLLAAAGYSLSDSDTFDLIIRFFIEKKIYDIMRVNEALDYYCLKPLACVQE